MRKAIKAAQAREAARKAKKKRVVVRKEKSEGTLSGKLTPAQSRNPQK